MELFDLLKIIHIISATVLFGTGIGTAFQMVWAWRTQDPKTIHSVASGVVAADWIFTTPAGLVQPVSGLALALMAGWPLTETWLLATYALYAIAFFCWAPVVALQLRIKQETKDTMELSARAKHAFRLWFALGWPAFISLVLVFALMVIKPSF